MTKKKILIFSLGYYPHIGGAEVAIKEITDQSSAEEFEFHLICNRYDSTLEKLEQVGNICVHRIGITTKNPTMGDLSKFPLHLNKLLFQWLAFRKAKQLHKREQFNAIWAMMAHATGVPAGKFKRAFSEVPYVLTLQEGDPPEYIEHKMRWFGKSFTNAFVLADVVQSISTFLASWARRQGFDGKSVVIPNAVDTAHFTKEVSAKLITELKQSLNKKDGDTFLVTTSRLVPKNGIDTVIEALPLLPPQVKFVVFGTGPEVEKLQSLASSLGVVERVLWRGQIGHDEMPSYLKACDIFIRPSRSEGMGNSFIEAMAAGLPVIATQEGGIADFLFDENRNPNQEPTGWAVDKDNPVSIKTAVTDILSKPAKVETVTTNSKAMVIEKYDWDLVAKRMQEEIFQPLFK